MKHMLCWPMIMAEGLSWPWSYGSWIYNYLCSQCLSPLMLWVRISIRGRCTTLCNKVCQWLATGRWFSPGPPVSTIYKTDRHVIHTSTINFLENSWQFFVIGCDHHGRYCIIVGFTAAYAISGYYL